MNPFRPLTGLILILYLSTITAGEPAVNSPDDAVRITIIYDNYQADQDLKTDWGFACLVEHRGRQILFDAGRDAGLYKTNLELLGIQPEKIPALFISHEHGDHTGGIPWIMEVNPSIKCYLPASYADQLKKDGTLPPNSKGLNRSTHLFGPFYSTGDDFTAFREQGLVIKTESGGVLIAGCGHPGAIPMISNAEKKLGIEIHTLVGGLHLMQKSDEELEQLAADLKGMGIEHICPTHCTGDRSIAILKDSFDDGYNSGGTGVEIMIR